MVTRKTEAKPKVLRLKKPQEPKEPSQVHLWTATDISHWRDRLSKEQKGIDPITQEPLIKPCLDHDHSKDSQRVRGVLSAATNAWEGRVLGCYHRYMKYSTDTPLSTLLKNLGEYYERNNDHMPLHTSWKTILKSRFKSLKEPMKDALLKRYTTTVGTNSKSRSAIFSDLLNAKKLMYYDTMKEIDNLGK